MKILVLAGGFDQIALIKELRNRGNIVYLADYFENPPAKQYADKHFQISTLDENAVYELAKKEQVDMFTTVFIGNSQTKEIRDHMVTPRGYRYE